MQTFDRTTRTVLAMIGALLLTTVMTVAAVGAEGPAEAANLQI